MKLLRSCVGFLALCLVLSCLSVAAWAQDVPEIQLGETITFSTTKADHVKYYSFTPKTSGTYVLYDLSDCDFQAWLSVHSVAPAEPTFDQSRVAKGLNQVVFQAEAGVTYWLMLDCSWISGGELSNSFMLAEPAAATGMDVAYVNLNSKFVGTEGSLYLRYTPMGSGSQISWTTTNPNVVTVEGDNNGCSFRLIGAGTSTITATAAEGFTAQYSVTALDVTDMELGQSLTITMPDADGSYISDEKYIRFTPTESGCYALSVSYPELDVWHGLEMSISTLAGYIRSDRTLRIDAHAGKTYTVAVEFWGMYDQAVDYTFTLQPCVAPTGIQLVPAATAGYVGSSLYVEVEWEPENSLGDKVSWSVSDEAIAQITASDDGSAQLRLLSEGIVTLQAVTEGGLSTSVELTVCAHPGVVNLVPGANPSLQMLRNDYFECTFTPEVTGYYRLSADNASLKLQLDAPVVVRDGQRLYYLEAGTQYFGGIDNLSQSMVNSVITVALVEVPTPTAISISKLPDQTEFLPGVLENIWAYDLLEGMEMEVTWSDGRTSTWVFDNDGTSYEGYEIRWELSVVDSNHTELIMKLGDATASCSLTVKDLTLVSMVLLNASEIQIVENSCGYYDAYADSWIYSEYLLGMYQVQLTFNDGSTINARAGQTVYGKRLQCQMDQYDKPWVKGGDNAVVYNYGEISIQVPVVIIDSPVRKIEFVSKPKNVFIIGDRQFFVSYGDGSYYFSPDSLKAYLEGLSFRIRYNDGTSKVVAWSDIQWQRISGELYPFVAGYPLGLLGELMMSFDPISGPSKGQGLVEFMGASVTYDIIMLEPVEDIPGTDDECALFPQTAVLIALLAMAAVALKKKVI